MLHERLKKIMDDIIEHAYADLPEEKRKQLKWYKIYILPNEKARSSGRYFYKENKIEVYNPRLGSDHMAKCCIHELAHRMSYCIHGSSEGTGHGKNFYAEYRKLIYAALDMNILGEETFNNDQWSSDQNKVRKIISEYEPNPVDYIMDFPPVIKVYNSYSIKDALRGRGYAWNSIEMLWEKETEDTENEIAFLESMGAVEQTLENENQREKPTFVVDENSMLMSPVAYIEAKGNTYDAREALKAHGFFFVSKGKKWVCKVASSAYSDKMIELRDASDLKGIEFTPMNRKSMNRKKFL